MGRKKGSKNKLRNFDYFKALEEKQLKAIHENQPLSWEDDNELKLIKKRYGFEVSDIMDVYYKSQIDRTKNLSPKYFTTYLMGIYTTRLRNTMGVRRFNDLLKQFNLTLDYLGNPLNWVERGLGLKLPNGVILEIHYDYRNGTKIYVQAQEIF